MNKIISVVFVFGLILRIILAITTYHSDLGAFALSGQYILNEGKILSLYDMTNKGNSTVFNYQPLAYIYPSVVYAPFSGIISSTYLKVQNNNTSELKKSVFYWPLLVYKIPMIMADVFIFIILPFLFSTKSDKFFARLLWWFNPVSIYVGSMMGQVDIVIAALLLLAYYFYYRKIYLLTAIIVAISALFKPVGLVLLPLLFIDKKNIKFPVAGFAVYILGIFPFISSMGYRYYALAAEQINKSTFSGITIASGTVIPWFFIFMAIIFLAVWFKRIHFLEAGISLVLSSLVFSHFHPQWLVWVCPLFIVWLLRSRKMILWPMLICCWIIILLSFDSTLHSGIFLFSNWIFELPLQGANIVLMSRAGLICILLIVLGLFSVNEKRKSRLLSTKM